MFLLIQPLTINYKNINKPQKDGLRQDSGGIYLKRNVPSSGRNDCNKHEHCLRSTPVQNTFILNRKRNFRVNSNRIWFQVMKVI